MPESVDSADEYYERLQEIFPNANCTDAPFYISMDIKSFSNILSNRDMIIIFCEYNCGCFRGTTRRPKTQKILVTKEQNSNTITIKDAIQAFYTHKYKAKCDHCYLEGFSQISDTEFIAEFGS